MAESDICKAENIYTARCRGAVHPGGTLGFSLTVGHRRMPRLSELPVRALYTTIYIMRVCPLHIGRFSALAQ